MKLSSSDRTKQCTNCSLVALDMTMLSVSLSVCTNTTTVTVTATTIIV